MRRHAHTRLSTDDAVRLFHSLFQGILMSTLTIYIAASFKHMHGVRLLGRELRALGCAILDWTEKAVPPPGLTPAQRRVWMDTDRDGGQVFAFCRDACLTADMVIYFGASGQDAGVEVGLACGAGVPVLGIRGPLEAPGLMLHGAMTTWAESVEEAVALVAGCLRFTAQEGEPGAESDARIRALCSRALLRRDAYTPALP